MSEVFRTPDNRFDNLPDFDFEPNYLHFEGVRQAYIDVGTGPTVLLLHGEPTWSFLWRKVIPPLVAAGYRCVAPDLIGFGRSDKPTAIEWYSYDRHYESIKNLIEELALTDVTLVVHDWGGPIGLRIATEQTQRIKRIVAMDSGVFNGHQRMSDSWSAFRAFVVNTPDLPIGMLIRHACYSDPGDSVIAAYDAPFPNIESKVGARTLPLFLPLSPDDQNAILGREILKKLKQQTRPTLLLWADTDRVLPIDTGRVFAERIGIDPPVEIPNAGHFLQEDQGQLIGEMIRDWLEVNRSVLSEAHPLPETLT